MAQAKRKERVSKVSAQEITLMKQIETLVKVEKKTDAQKAQLSNLKTEAGKLRFIRLAVQRVPRAVKAVRGIGNLSGSGYTYTPEQAEKIVNALKAAVEFVADKFSGSAPASESFTL